MIDVVVLLEYSYSPCFNHFTTINFSDNYFMQTCIMCFISDDTFVLFLSRDDTFVLAGWSS